MSLFLIPVPPRQGYEAHALLKYQYIEESSEEGVPGEGEGKMFRLLRPYLIPGSISAAGKRGRAKYQGR